MRCGGSQVSHPLTLSYACCSPSASGAAVVVSSTAGAASGATPAVFSSSIVYSIS